MDMGIGDRGQGRDKHRDRGRHGDKGQIWGQGTDKGT